MEKQKHIWIVNYYAAPPKYVSNARHLQFAHYLQEAGYKVTIFLRSFFFVQNVDVIEDDVPYKVQKEGEFNFVYVKVRHYKGNGLDRMFSIWEFARKILKYRNDFEHPDIILQNIHAPFDTSISLCAKKLKSRYIAEAWDLWPADFVTFGLVSAKNPVLKWAFGQEKKMYYRASDIIFSFAGGMDYLKSHNWTKTNGGRIDENRVHYINNGISISEFDINKEKYVLNDSDVENSKTFKIVYLGSIRLANDVKQLIDAMILLKDHKDIVLLVYGNGEQREPLIKYCTENNITNVIFKKEWIPLRNVPYVMSHADLNILNYQKGFGHYGISSGKLFQSLAAGKPILCNIDIPYDDVITEKNLGHSGWIDSPQKYAEEILRIYNMDKDCYKSICDRVRETAYRFDYKVLSENLIKIIERN